MKHSAVIQQKRDHSRRHLKAAAALVCAVLLLAGMLFFAFYTAAESGHVCHETGCPVCAQISQARQVLNSGSGLLHGGAAFLPALLATCLLLCIPELSAPVRTLVTYKIRMND